MKHTKKMAAVVVLVGMALVGGTAYAIWSANGSGSGRAQARTAQVVTVNASTGSADLYPGFTDGDLFFTLTNTNPYPVQFTALSSGTITSSDETNCPASNITVDNATGLTLNVGPNATSGSLSVADIVNMATAAPDGCQGKTFTVAVTLTGSQV